MTDEIQRSLGRHEAEIESLQKDLLDLKVDVKIILATLSEARGGWKTLLLVAGVAGAVGALGVKLSSFIGWFPK